MSRITKIFIGIFLSLPVLARGTLYKENTVKNYIGNYKQE